MSKTNNTLDKILHRLARYYEAVGRSKTPPNKTDFAKAKKEIESLLADREKKMLEFVRPKKKDLDEKGPMPDNLQRVNNDGYNQAIDGMSQRAKEWRGRE